MYILTQDSMAIFEITRFDYISVTEEGKVVAGDEHLNYFLGAYKDASRAQEVVEEIFTMIGSVDKYVMPII